MTIVIISFQKKSSGFLSAPTTIDPDPEVSVKVTCISIEKCIQFVYIIIMILIHMMYFTCFSLVLPTTRLPATNVSVNAQRQLGRAMADTLEHVPSRRGLGTPRSRARNRCLQLVGQASPCPWSRPAWTGLEGQRGQPKAPDST